MHEIAPHPTLSRYYSASEGKLPFVRRIFNDTARDYDRVERWMAFGSGPWYRRQALLRAGLAANMRVLDVAVGTGLVAREEVAIVGDANLVTGLDPSIGMISEARKSLGIATIVGIAEQLPLPNACFDFLSMGYALRHLTDLRTTFREFFRVLRPGGRLCVLEITRPHGRIARYAMKAYMRFVIPTVTRFMTRRADTQRIWEYYWDTIESCVPTEQVLEAISAAGFSAAAHYQELGMFSEYTAIKPA